MNQRQDPASTESLVRRDGSFGDVVCFIPSSARPRLDTMMYVSVVGHRPYADSMIVVLLSLRSSIIALPKLHQARSDYNVNGIGLPAKTITLRTCTCPLRKSCPECDRSSICCCVLLRRRNFGKGVLSRCELRSSKSAAISILLQSYHSLNKLSGVTV